MYMKVWSYLLASLFLIAIFKTCRGTSREDEPKDALARYRRFFAVLSKHRRSVPSQRSSNLLQHSNHKRSTRTLRHYERAKSLRYHGYRVAAKVRADPANVAESPTTVTRNRLTTNELAMRQLQLRLMQARKQVLRNKLQKQEEDPWWGIWSTWSACGRSCGSGVQFQERHCLGARRAAIHRHGKTICDGPTKRYKICNPDPCPTNTISFRKLQCAQHAAEMVRGSYYSWKPYGYPVDEVVSNEPCQLVCVSDANDIQINTIAMDGTECHMGWNPGRCVEGKCQLIGCDGKINSNILRNKCGKCDGDGTTCIIRDDVFSDVFRSIGDYQVVRIPSGAYDILINERKRTSASIVVKDTAHKVLFNGGGKATTSAIGSEGWPSNIMIAGAEFRYRRPVLQSSDVKFEYLLSEGPIEESIIVYLRAELRTLGVLHYEFKIPIPEIIPPSTTSGTSSPTTAESIPTTKTAATTNNVKSTSKTTITPTTTEFGATASKEITTANGTALNKTEAIWLAENATRQHTSARITTISPRTLESLTIQVDKTIGAVEILPDANHIPPANVTTEANKETTELGLSNQHFEKSNETTSTGVAVSNETLVTTATPYPDTIDALPSQFIIKHMGEFSDSLSIVFANATTVKTIERPKVLLQPEWDDPTEHSRDIKHGRLPEIPPLVFLADVTDPALPRDEGEEFLLIREIEEIPVSREEESEHVDLGVDLASNDSRNRNAEEAFFGEPPITILSADTPKYENIGKIFRLEATNKTELIAGVSTVERHIPHENETYDNDVAGEDDDIPADGGEDYSFAPGVNIPIPVRYGVNHGGHYSSSTSSEYGWRTNGYAPCSSTCTVGLQDSYALCQRLSDQLTVDDSYCNPTTRPEPVRRSCVNKRCEPRWEATPWSECSLSCGTGIQMRTVRCWRMIGPGFDSTLYTERCDKIAEQKPEETKPCKVLDKCGPLWETSDWSNCPAPCGKIGVKWRTVRCSAGPDYMCASSPRPITEEECRGPQCLLNWMVTDWGECSGVCGGGRKTRRVICVDRIGNAHPEDQCDPTSKPATSHPCGDTNCRPEWIAQDWEECSMECGLGTRTRKVMCAGIINGEVHHYEDDSPCSGTEKPSDLETCNMKDCDPVWFTTSWSKCSVTCGGGHRVREIKCYLKNAPATGCNATERPPDRETCTMPACPQPRHEQCKDKRTVNCALVLRVRLCTHWYYRKACCGSCQSGERG